MRKSILSHLTLVTLFVFSFAGHIFGVDNTPPVLSNIKVENISFSSATISWETDEFSTSFVDYYKSEAAGVIPKIIAAGQGDNRKKHSVSLTNLSPGKKYYYRVLSNDPSGNEAKSAYTSFSTSSLLSIPTIKLNVSPIVLLTSAPTSTAAPTPSFTPTPTAVTTEVSPTVSSLSTEESSSDPTESQTDEPTESPKNLDPTPEQVIGKSEVASIPLTTTNIVGGVIILILAGAVIYLVASRNKVSATLPKEQQKEDSTVEKPQTDKEKE